MKAAAAACEGQMLSNRSSLGEGRDPGSLTHSLSHSLPIHVLDIAATSQDGSILRMQGAEGCCLTSRIFLVLVLQSASVESCFVSRIIQKCQYLLVYS